MPNYYRCTVDLSMYASTNANRLADVVSNQRLGVLEIGRETNLVHTMSGVVGRTMGSMRAELTTTIEARDADHAINGVRAVLEQQGISPDEVVVQNVTFAEVGWATFEVNMLAPDWVPAPSDTMWPVSKAGCVLQLIAGPGDKDYSEWFDDEVLVRQPPRPKPGKIF